MKKLLFIVLLLISLIANSQEKKLQILTNQKEIVFLVEKDGKIFENYILQFEKSSYKDLSGNYNLFEIIFDNKSGLMSLIINNKIYYFATNQEIKLNNINYCFGIAKRTGDFKLIKDFNLEESFYSSVVSKFGSYQNVVNMTCDSGGPGSTSCSSETTIGPLTTKCDVSCGTGFYSCCDDGTNNCKCIAVGTPPKHLSAGRFTLVVNPTKNILTFIGNDFSKYKIRVFDLRSGEMPINNITLSEEINISKLKAGIYGYNIYDDAGFEQNGKVIIKN